MFVLFLTVSMVLYGVLKYNFKLLLFLVVVKFLDHYRSKHEKTGIVVCFLVFEST